MKDFFSQIPHKFKPDEEALLKKALDFATRAHAGQKRNSGEDFIIHPVQAAIILGRIFPDASTIAATLLHDITEDTKTTPEELEKEFGKEIADLVDGVTKLGHVRLRNSKDEFYLENLRKMFIATSKDIRVILIKLADRLHNMDTIQYLPADKQMKVATETLEMYGPLAGRLGIGSWKGELQDKSFAVVDPKAYAETKELLEKELTERAQSIKDVQKQIASVLRRAGIKFNEIQGRTKHIYSLYHKLKKYEGDASKIYDVVAVRIITKSVADCYLILGTIHQQFQSVPGRVKDYIATPKPNGYQSLHTAVFDNTGKIFEIQIRTDLMHEEAERGIAAHWFYTESHKTSNPLPGRSTTWIKELRAWQEETAANPDEFLESLQIDFFRDRIFVLTPKGDVKDLPFGATVIDFAFSVHTDLGYHMMGVKINGKMRKIFDELKQGDVVEILKTKKPAVISRDWLKAARTSSARSKIRHYLAEHDKGLFQRVKELRLQNFTLPRFFRKKIK
jgi:GTP pyrophosphokinase